ncbi:helix-turn-helix transcriptional regulator [Anabaena cylindrica FACHB-243]|uniref:Transcriptional regulator, PadR family n=1 Tax=Anabaena cylindrica (strain ATCC 27899 / PCC 7122) TaxID=272123 RepID=K9ZRG7_ANACC|nr:MULTISPECIES: PadR family transcriptional regulator [Anabaena]AFZ61137.1 transcriptional regulator, PadR family [Anabaena cylindrica PCC 7122]MBD2421613.1 helix-turn-helix transcriptional regulator [Anabaena cylindrica FACHB-243]MBY5280488.1 helix-turn-helix transcriptional regulator [Anabaena sp. CCAP 1446/1C]MBY5308219.1 helix-turn-helix transcriptional regulator [Anabaena sp. CCAP 1446/1C]MCM2405486.1 PadR family transcriptional regulator [Anabaena sp. CCAP 1446/1C]
MAKKNEELITLSALEEDLLTVLRGKELYGLQVMNAINEASDGKRQIGFGSLYPTLHRMEKKGLVKSRWGEETDPESGGARRKYYEITGLGEQVLRETQEYRAHLAGWKPVFIEQLNFVQLLPNQLGVEGV